MDSSGKHFYIYYTFASIYKLQVTWSNQYVQSTFIHFFTLARPENREQLETEIRKAHVICIVYAIDDPNTFNRLPLFWLPYIRSLGVNVSYFYSTTSICTFF